MAEIVELSRGDALRERLVAQRMTQWRTVISLLFLATVVRGGVLCARFDDLRGARRDRRLALGASSLAHAVVLGRALVPQLHARPHVLLERHADARPAHADCRHACRRGPGFRRRASKSSQRIAVTIVMSCHPHARSAAGIDRVLSASYRNETTLGDCPFNRAIVFRA